MRSHEKRLPGEIEALLEGDAARASQLTVVAFPLPSNDVGDLTVTNASGTTVDSGSYLSVSHKSNGKWLYCCAARQAWPQLVPKGINAWGGPINLDRSAPGLGLNF